MCPSNDALSYAYYCGPAYPASPAEGGWPGYQREPETDQIAGRVRLVEDQEALVVIGNGERPETFWMVDCDEWASAVERALDALDGPAVGRCLACGRFTKGGAVMCSVCGLDEDRRNAGQ